MSETEADQRLVRQYRRLRIAQSDLVEAYKYLDCAMGTSACQSGEERAQTVARALSLAMVVAYARPFLKSNSEGVRPTTSLVQGVLKNLTPEEKKLHKRMLELRHSELAHSAAAAHDAALTLRTPKDGSAQRVAIAIMRQTGRPLAKEEMESFRDLIAKVLGSVSTKLAELGKRLPDGECF